MGAAWFFHYLFISDEIRDEITATQLSAPVAKARHRGLSRLGHCLEGNLTLRMLGYTPHNEHQLLGIARSTVFRRVNGKSQVSGVVARWHRRYGVPVHRNGPQ